MLKYIIKLFIVVFLFLGCNDDVPPNGTEGCQMNKVKFNKPSGCNVCTEFSMSFINNSDGNEYNFPGGGISHGSFSSEGTCLAKGEYTNTSIQCYKYELQIGELPSDSYCVATDYYGCLQSRKDISDTEYEIYTRVDTREWVIDDRNPAFKVYDFTLETNSSTTYISPMCAG